MVRYNSVLHIPGRNFNDVKNHPFFKSVIWMDVAQYRGPVIYTPTLDNPNDTRYFEAQYTERTVSHETLAASRTSIHSSLIIEGRRKAKKGFDSVR